MATAAQTTNLMTAEQLLALPDDGLRRELILGEVRTMAPAGSEHGKRAGRVATPLCAWIYSHPVGEILIAEPGFILARDPDTVRAPDLAFFVTDRVPPDKPGFVEVMPDLVLEVVSPNDREVEVVEKAAAWLTAGVRVVWVLWPGRRELQVWRPDGTVRSLGPADELTCKELLPGFRLPLAKVLG
jgi:Uma2 family endonuclease